MMKISRWFIGIMVVLFALLVLFEVNSPNRFEWDKKTYGHYDSNPFGAMLVDSLLSSSLKNHYQVKAGDINVAYNDSSVKNSALLLVDNFDPSIYQETSMLIDLLERGQTIIIFTNEEFNESLERQLGINLSSDRYYTYSNSTNKSDSIICEWQGDSCYDDARYIFRLLDYEMSYLVPDYNDVRSGTDDYDYGYDNYGYEYEDDDYRYEDDDYGYEDDEYGYESVSSPYEYEDEYDPKRLNFEWTELMLTSDNYNECVVAVGNCDKGKLVLVSLPWLFSNYYVLEDGGAQLLMRILSQAGDKPIVRYDYNMDTDTSYIAEKNKSESPLRVFLDNKSLRWSVYLTLFTILLSLIFTARRKQRVIPLVEEPKNQTIEMIKHIGLMYYRSHDNAGLISEKYRQLTFELMKKKLIYLDDVDGLDKSTLNTLAQLAEVDNEKFCLLLDRIKTIDNSEKLNIKNKETKKLINFMNKILNNL